MENKDINKIKKSVIFYNKLKDNKILILQSSISIGVGVGLLLLNSVYIYGSENIQTNNIGYLEDNGKFVLPIHSEEEKEAVDKTSENFENPKVTVSSSNTLLEYEGNIDYEEYLKENQEDLVEGYELVIDNEYKLYLENKDLVDGAINSVAAFLIDNQNEYENYLETKNFDDIIIGDKAIYSFDIVNDIKINKKYVPKKELIKTSEELLFDISHEGYNDENFKKEEYTVLKGESFEDVLIKNDISEYEFHINNPKYRGKPLLEEGEQIVINKINPIIDVAIHYKESEEEIEEFDTIRKDDKELAYGDEELEQKGKNGMSLVTYDKTMINGEVVSIKMLKKESIKDPVSRIIREGTDESQSSNGAGDVNGDTTPSEASNGAGFIWPTASRSVSRGLQVGHNGTDIVGSYGDPEYAAADGVVAAAGWSPYGGGYEVQIDHGGGLYTVYSHMAQMPNVSVGQSVYQGQVIGYMGQTGLAFGVHLHFEVRVGCSGDAFSGTPVTPGPYMG